MSCVNWLSACKDSRPVLYVVYLGGFFLQSSLMYIELAVKL